MGRVNWLDAAVEDLHAITDPSVVAQIIDVAECELREVGAASSIEGQYTRSRKIFWRRAVPLATVTAFESPYDRTDDDDFRCQACDYVLVYRRATRREAGELTVVRVVTNGELARDILKRFRPR